MSPRFERLTIEDGLSQGLIADIFQDRRGFLWFATGEGLNRYDGHTVKVYEPVPFDTTSLADGNLSSVHEDRAGALWVATQYGGLARLDADETFTHFRHDPADPHSLSHDHTTAVFVDRRGILWVGTEAGLNRMEPDRPGRFTQFRHDPTDPTSLSHDAVRSLSEDATGALWVATADGLNRLDSATDRFARYLHDPDRPGEPGRALHRQFVDARAPTVRWIGSDSGLVRFDAADGSARRYLPNPRGGAGQNVVVDVSADPWDPGVLWVPVRDVGLARFDTTTETFTLYPIDANNPHGLVEHAGSTVYTDRSGTVWVGSSGGGLNRFDPAAIGVTHIGAATAEAPGLVNPNVWGLGVTRDDTVWAGTSGGALHRFDPAAGTVRVWASANGRLDPDRPSDEANAFAEEPDGTLWIGTIRGLDRYDPATGRFARYRHDPADSTSLSDDNVLALHHDRDGTLWVGTIRGLNRFDRGTGTFTRYLPDPGDGTTLGDDWAAAIFEDRAGMLWVGTRSTVSRLDRATGRFTNFRHDRADATTPTHGPFVWLHEREREPGVLWAASADGGGLDRIDTRTGTVAHFTTTSSEIPDNTVYAVLEDAEGRLWLSTNRGLARFDPDEPKPGHTFRRFGPESGLPGLEFNQHAAARGPDGRLYFGGVDGLVAFHPDDLVGNPIPPPVVLTGLRVGNERVRPGPGSVLSRPLSETQTVTLAHDQRNVAFEFAALHFKAPERNRYRYRLDGFDSGWVEAGTRPAATYTNLPPGRYTFHVIASNSDGVWNEEGAALALTVVPPPWQTWWAYLGYGLLAVGLLTGAYRARRRRHELRHRLEIEQIEAEQLRELDRARSRFFANVSHEFRTPLTLTLGPLDDIKAGLYGPLDAPLAQQVDLARRNAGRVLDLINQILDVARLESGRTPLRARPLDLGAFVVAVAQPFQALAARKAITFEVDRPATPIEVFADPLQLEKAVANLLSNALKFTPEGGTVRVTVAAEGGMVHVAVRDSGPGIPAADVAHVLDRFYQVNESRQTQLGTGIGLALAKEVVDLHGGTLAVESEEGFGSTFTITLPIGHAHLDPEQLVADEPWSPAETLQEGSAFLAVPGGDGLAGEDTPAAEPPIDDDVTTVLVIEDHAEVRAYVRRHLASAAEGSPAYRVLEAADGEAGLALAKECLPDLIVSDVMMPKLDGLALCRALKADPETDFIPVILLTAKAAPEDKLEALGEHCDDYLTKPFDPAELRARIANLIAVRTRLRERFRLEGITGGDDAPVPLRLPAPQEMTSADDAFLERVREAVEARLGDEAFSVSSLAEEVGVSRGHLHRQLKALAGQTPTDLIRTARLERAAHLLDGRAGSVSEIAYAVGFKSVAYFSDSFVRAYGCRPSSYAAREGMTEDTTG
ncbi:MAG: two-component regulator propeller domain-containing protein [Rhodothermales bacterium]